MERLANKRKAWAQRKDCENRIADGFPASVPGEGFIRFVASEENGFAPERNKTLEMALETFGGRMQIVVAIEEASELQKELCKSLRGRATVANIAEEIADVQIMLEQMIMLFECQNSVEMFRQEKLQRLEKRIAEAKKDGTTDI